ncbi:MAG: terminase [Bacteroidales bacterium]|nr:terminase [Bacteroidales bacterium]
MRREWTIAEMLAENERRKREFASPFNPLTGEGSIGKRCKVAIDGLAPHEQWLPEEMLEVPLVRALMRRGSVKAFLEKDLRVSDSAMDRSKVAEQFIRVRMKYDFAFWAALLAYIKNKGGGDDVLFRLNRPQRRLIERFEERRRADEPIRLILLKARQWGGSTAIQIYMAWLQLVHEVGLNSLIVGLQNSVADEIKDMFDRLVRNYPIELLYEIGERYDARAAKMTGVGKSGYIHRIPQRNCKIKIGSAERPDSVRGGDYNLVHCSEVGLWRKTEGKSPEDMVRSACSGVLLKGYTMIVYESTANGTGNFFHTEYESAKRGESQFEAMFVAWYEIEQYRLAVEDEEDFARRLIAGRERESAENDRRASGRYLWSLWERGATLEAIAWYIEERAKFHDDGDMASEFPSDDIEAFVHSGARVFDRYKVEQLRGGCRMPRWRGELVADGEQGAKAMEGLRFAEDSQGALWIWEMPEADDDGSWITDRYLVTVDIGGRGMKSDWSVIVVFDRLMQMEGGKPMVVAQWYGHIDMDLLAWKAAQVAAYYNDALLVIESNTLETHDPERRDKVEGDMSGYILNQIKGVYPNLYARTQTEDEIRDKVPLKYGFHTNVATKPMVISTLVKVLREGLYTERDERCLDEYLCYERKPNGAYGAISGKHDDLLMTRAIGLHIAMNEMPLPRIVTSGSVRVGHRDGGMAAI